MHAYTDGPGVARCDAVLHFETLVDDWTRKMADEPDRVKALTAELAAYRANPTDSCNVSVGILNKTMRARIAKLYAVDFERFGYAADLVPDEAEGAARRDGISSDFVSVQRVVGRGWRLHESERV